MEASPGASKERGAKVDVSVLIPVRDEEPHIRDTAMAMLVQRYEGSIEFLFMEGRSEDGTKMILEELARDDSRIRVLDNPRREIPNALNIGLQHARGEFIVRMDAHAFYPSHYVEAGVKRLRQGGVEWVSGPQVPVGVGRWSRRVALALRSPLGTAASLKWPSALRRAGFDPAGSEAGAGHEFELSAESGVFGGVWRRATLEQLGGWDERWPVNEDSELLARFVESGRRAVLRPELSARYMPRDDLRSLARQYWRYGIYREKTSRRHPATLRPIHVIPPALILATLVGAATRGPARRASAAAVGLYTLLLFWASRRSAEGTQPRDLVSLPAVFATMHGAWSLGYLYGCARFGPPTAAIAGVLARRTPSAADRPLAGEPGPAPEPGRIRVLHVTESFASGVFGVVKAIAERLASEGHSVTIAHGRRPETPEDVRDLVDPSVDLIELPWRIRTPREEIRAAIALRRLIASLHPDVVHLHSSFAGLLGALACPGSIPVVYSPHAYSFLTAPPNSIKRSGYRLAERLIARRVDVIGAVSEYEADEARALAPRGRVAVVPNGIEELDDPPPRSPDDRRERTIIAVGRIGPQREPEAAARILSQVADLAEPVWIGAEPQPGHATEILRASGVRITGWLSRAETTQHMRGATALLHWSAWEGQSLTLLEAFAAGLPVVASDIPPNREVLGDSEVFSTEADAAAALRRLLTDERYRGRILDNQERRRGFYSARRMTGQWLDLYCMLATKRARRMTALSRGDAIPDLASGT